MSDILSSVLGVGGTIALNAVNGAQIRGEVSEWVSLIGTIAITLTTICIQIYRLIRDRNTDKNQPAEAENEDKEHDEKNG